MKGNRFRMVRVAKKSRRQQEVKDKFLNNLQKFHKTFINQN